MTDRVCLGYHPDGTNGLRVSEEDYDVLSNPIDPERLLFDSSWVGSYPILFTGSLSLTSGVETDVFFPEELDFIPTVHAFIDSRGTALAGYKLYSLEFYGNLATSKKSNLRILLVDKTKFTILVDSVYNAGAGETIKYAVFRMGFEV